MMLFFPVAHALGKEGKTEIPLRKWRNEAQRLKEQRQVKAWTDSWDKYISQKQSATSNLGKSVLLPGMGQFACGKVVRGSVFLGAVVSSFGGSAYFLMKSSNSYEKYKTAGDIDDIEKYWDESQRTLRYCEISALAGVAFWLANAVDAYLTTRSYNSGLFEDFYHSTSSVVPSLNIGFDQAAADISLVWRF